MAIIIDVEGHPDLLGTHKSTWQITKDKYLTSKGDCIIGIKSSHGASDLPNSLKNHLKQNGQILVSIIQDKKLIISGKYLGNLNMSCTHDHDIVFRRSGFIDDRTVGILGSLTAKDFPRDFILRNKTEIRRFQVLIEMI
ncbi:MAG: DUF371 domain-containing protein [Candidatus Heimdallarchaeota archaeon]|nr:DUF371 domain-containing protein [Candidatus Heimdallarchaeota archaeon]